MKQSVISDYSHFVCRNQQYERDSDGLAPLGAGYDGDNFPLRKTGVAFYIYSFK